MCKAKMNGADQSRCREPESGNERARVRREAERKSVRAYVRCTSTHLGVERCLEQVRSEVRLIVDLRRLELR